MMDEVKRDYMGAIRVAIYDGDNDLAAWYAAGLREYREYYQDVE